MRKLSLIAALSVGLTGIQANANELGVSLNNDTVTVNFNAAVTPEAVAFGNFTYSEPNGELFEGGAEMVNIQGVHTLAIGGKYLYLSLDDADNSSALAFSARYRLDLAPQTSFRLEGGYSPSVLSFDDLDKYSQIDASVNFLVMPTVEIYGGWRQIEFDIGRDVSFDKGYYLGTRFTF